MTLQRFLRDDAMRDNWARNHPLPSTPERGMRLEPREAVRESLNGYVLVRAGEIVRLVPRK